MKNNISSQKNILFGILLLIGILYSVVLLILIKDIATSCFLQLARFTTINEIIFGILTVPEFLTNFIALIVLIYLFVRFVKSGVLLFLDHTKTKNFIENLKLKKGTDFFIFESDKINVFTQGLLKPVVYVSTGALEKLSQREMKAVLIHENFHVRNFDPLRTIILRLIQRAIPSFGLLNYIIKEYETINEFAADCFAENLTASRKEIVSSLYKFMNFNESENLNIKMFFGERNRIGYLVGTSKFNYVTLLSLGFMITIFLTGTITGFVGIRPFNKCTDFTYCYNSHVDESETNVEKCLEIQYSSENNQFMSREDYFSSK